MRVFDAPQALVCLIIYQFTIAQALPNPLEKHTRAHLRLLARCFALFLITILFRLERHLTLLIVSLLMYLRQLACHLQFFPSLFSSNMASHPPSFCRFFNAVISRVCTKVACAFDFGFVFLCYPYHHATLFAT